VADDLTSLYYEQASRRFRDDLDAWLAEPPSRAHLAPRQQYEALVDELAPQYGVDPVLAKQMIQVESGWNPRAVSPKGAQGIAQLMPQTARRFGVSDAFNPEQAIPGMLRYLKTLTDEFGDPTKVVAAYNAGEGAVRQYGGVPPYDETLNYVRKVFGGAEPQGYTSKRADAGSPLTPMDTQDLTQRAKTALEAPTQPPVSEQMVDTTLPSITPETVEAASAAAQVPPPQPYTSKAAGQVMQRTEPGLEEPVWQRLAPRVMEGMFGALAGVSGLPITAGRLLGLPEREAEQLFPQAAGLRNAFRDIAKTFDPTGQEENIIDRFAQTVGQQIVFFGSGAAVAGGAGAIAEFAPAIGRALGATTAAVQEAGLEAEQALDALTPIVGAQEAASRANTVFWRNVGVLALTNKLGVFGEGAMPGLLKLSAAASMEWFQEVVQYDQGRRQFWVDARHPMAAELQALGWKRHAQRVYQPFDLREAAEIGVIAALIGGGAQVVRDAAGRQVLPREQEATIRQGLETLARATGSLLTSARASVAGRTGAPPASEQQQFQAIRERVRSIEDSQVRDAEGRLMRMYHGTPRAFPGPLALTEADPGALYGPGLYFTDTPDVAAGYAREPVPDAQMQQGLARVPALQAQLATIEAELASVPPESGRRVLLEDQRRSVQQSIAGLYTPAVAPNVRPVYLDIKRPFDVQASYTREDVLRILRDAGRQDVADRAAQLISRQRFTGDELFHTLAGEITDYDDLSADQGRMVAQQALQQAGYDGITHTGGAITGGQPHRVYIAFSPEQVISAFELEAHPWFRSVLAYADTALEAPPASREAATVEGVGIGPSFIGSQRGALGGGGFGGMPFPQRPSPPPRKPKALTLQQGATGLERGQFRDDQGRWRIPLRDIPSVELELQDFIRQQGGIRLTGEELAGELQALISRKETGTAGLQNNTSGSSLQQMADRAQELGFLATADKVALLEALDRSVNQGHLVYSPYATGTIPLLQNPTLAGLYQDVVTLAETATERTQEQRRGTRPRTQVHEEARQMIESGQWTLQDVRELLPGTVLSDETASAMVQTLGRMASDIADVARQFAESNAEPGSGASAEQDFLTGFALLAGVQPQRLGAIAEAGRSLGILNDPLSPVNAMLNQLVTLLAQSPGMNSKKLAQKYLRIYDSLGGKEAIKFGTKALTPGYGGMLLELYYQGMLSNPKTWLVNEVSNAATAAWALPVRFATGMISQFAPHIQTPEVNLGSLQFRSIHLGGSGEVSLTESAAYAYGLMHMMQKAWQMSAIAFKTEQPQFGREIPGILEPVGQRKTLGPALTTEHLKASGFPIDPESPVGKFADFWFEWVGLATGGRLGSKIMESRDEFYKFLNYGGELAALAYRNAVQHQTLDPQASFADNMARILAEPLPEELHQAAANHALIQTFQNELTGKIGQIGAAVQQWAPDIPGLGEFPVGRLIVPFLHIATNIPRYALENSPVAPFFKSVRDDLVAGGARADLAQGKMLMGTMTMATFALMASSGLITGRGPEDKDLRQAMERVGWKPYSVFVPWLGNRGGYVSLRAFDPIVGQHAGLMADIVEITSDQRLDWYEKAILGPIFAATLNISSRTWMRGVADFFDVFAPRSMRELEGESAYEGLRGFVRGRVSAAVPAVWGVAEKTMDPATKLAWGIVDAARAKTPGWSAGMPNYRNKWGDKRLLGWGWSPGWLNWLEGFTEAVSPLQVSTLVGNPLDRLLVRDQIRLAMPTRTLGMRGPRQVAGMGAEDAMTSAEATDPYAAKPIALKAEQYEKLVALSALNGDAIRELGLVVNPKALEQLRQDIQAETGERPPASVGPDLYSVLLWATTTKRYRDGAPGPQGEREELLRDLDSHYRTFGREQLLANDAELRQQFLTARALRQLQQTPLSQRDRLRPTQERQLRREDERLRIGAPR
jgi:hypothetical protein